VARPLLDVRHRRCERSVDGATLPERRLLVADRGEQGVCEADTRVIELDDAFPDGRLETPEDALAIAVRRRDHLDRRPGEGRDLQQDIERLTG
jgi:hypothetical protein